MQSARTLLVLLEVCLVCLLVGAKEKTLDFRITTFEGKDLCFVSSVIVMFVVNHINCSLLCLQSPKPL